VQVRRAALDHLLEEEAEVDLLRGGGGGGGGHLAADGRWEIAALYAEKLTLEEIRELTRFYSSGVGAKFIAMLPELMQQSMLLGQRWGEAIGREIESEARQELKKRGINI
jgi:hypothetical protein